MRSVCRSLAVRATMPHTVISARLMLLGVKMESVYVTNTEVDLTVASIMDTVTPFVKNVTAPMQSTANDV